MLNNIVNFLKKIVKKFLPKSYRSKIEKNFKIFHAANSIDKKMLKYLDYNNGFYIEIGANDGVLQSNTLYYEKNKRWSGILVEPIKEKFKNLKKNRSSENFFFNKALVSFEYQRKTIPMIYSDLMTTTKEVKNLDLKKQLLEGDKHLNIYEKKNEFIAETSTLNEIIILSTAPKMIDFFSLDTEGYEEEILNGVNFNEFNFKFLLVECINNFEKINLFLSKKNYRFLEKISHIDYLFKFKN